MKMQIQNHRSNRQSRCIPLHKVILAENVVVETRQKVRNAHSGSNDRLTPNTRLDRLGDMFVSNWRWA